MLNTHGVAYARIPAGTPVAAQRFEENLFWEARSIQVSNALRYYNKTAGAKRCGVRQRSFADIRPRRGTPRGKEGKIRSLWKRPESHQSSHSYRCSLSLSWYQEYTPSFPPFPSFNNFVNVLFTFSAVHGPCFSGDAGGLDFIISSKSAFDKPPVSQGIPGLISAQVCRSSSTTSLVYPSPSNTDSAGREYVWLPISLSDG